MMVSSQQGSKFKSIQVLFFFFRSKQSGKSWYVTARFKRCSSIWHCKSDKIQCAGLDHMQWWRIHVPTALPPAEAQCQEMEIYAKPRQMMLGAGGCQVLREPLGKSKVHWRLLVNFQSGAVFFFGWKAAMRKQLRAGEKLTDGFIVWKADFFFFCFSAVWRKRRQFLAISHP